MLDAQDALFDTCHAGMLASGSFSGFTAIGSEEKPPDKTEGFPFLVIFSEPSLNAARSHANSYEEIDLSFRVYHNGRDTVKPYATVIHDYFKDACDLSPNALGWTMPAGYTLVSVRQVSSSRERPDTRVWYAELTYRFAIARSRG